MMFTVCRSLILKELILTRRCWRCCSLVTVVTGTSIGRTLPLESTKHLVSVSRSLLLPSESASMFIWFTACPLCGILVSFGDCMLEIDVAQVDDSTSIALKVPECAWSSKTERAHTHITSYFVSIFCI